LIATSGGLVDFFQGKMLRATGKEESAFYRPPDAWKRSRQIPWMLP
jgi:hypothetical protein